MDVFDWKVGLVQRVVPSYRAPFFNALGRACTHGLGVFTGEAKSAEMIKPAHDLEDAQLTFGKNIHIFNGRMYLCYQSGLMNWLSDWDPDVLILEANPRYLSSQAAVRWMHKKNRPVIGWGLGAPSLGTGLFGRLRQVRRENFLNQFDTLITYSQAGAEEYAQMGFPEESIFVAVNAVTPKPDHPLPARRTGEKLRLLFVGRLQERKNVNNLILACASLPEEIQPELAIVGDGPAKEKLMSLAQQVYPEASFIGALYGDKLVEQFKEADLFVLPGTGGLAIQQAMTYGLPVIAAEADGTQQDLVRPENGWQIPPNDIQALIETLQTALSDIKGLREKGLRSYKIASEEINLEQMVSVFIKAINWSIS